MTETQNTAILNHLLTGCSLTSLEALKYFNCFRLSARVRELKDKGFSIKTEMIKTNSGKRISKYSMV